MIVIRGAGAPTPELAVTAEQVPDAGTWYVLVDGAHRPISVAELHRQQAAGELDDRSLIWREGFDDWRELGTVDELRRGAPRAERWPASLNAAPPSARAVRSLARAASPSLEAVQSSTDASTLKVARSSAEATSPSVDGAAVEAAGGAAIETPVLRNQRHETSVLFSLSNLVRLAAPPSATASSAISKEGSGLLDMRTIAGALAPARTHDGLPDLPVFGPTGFGEPAVLVPQPPSGRDRRLVWALAASVGALGIVTVLLAVIVLRGSSAPARADARAPDPGAAGAPTHGAATLASRGSGVPGAGAAVRSTSIDTSATHAARSAATGAPPTTTAATVGSPTTSADGVPITTAATAGAPAAGAASSGTPRDIPPTSAVTSITTAATAGGPAVNSAEPGSASGQHVAAPSAAQASSGSTGSPHAAPSAIAPPHATTASPGSSSSSHEAGHASSPPSTSASGPAIVRALPPAPTNACSEVSEVSCLVNGYADKCCEVFRERAAGNPGGPASPPVDPSLPDRLDRDAIAAGLARIDMRQCRPSSVHGDVAVSVKVSPAGAVTAVNVKSSPDPALTACVTAAALQGTFARTQHGGSFGYVWRF